MAQFIEQTVADMKGGRESWRVILALSLPSLVLALSFSVLVNGH